VDLSGVYESRQYVRAWATTELVSRAAQTEAFRLITFGPADVGEWKKRMPRGRFSGQPGGLTFNADLAEG
jgi:hypothetical protein